jgi:hypothetical protein
LIAVASGHHFNEFDGRTQVTQTVGDPIRLPKGELAPASGDT